ncbi:citrate/2-methylcitrate synthase [Nocardioides sp.]|uniref:citrate/2-methylcitrate synthase n=1 Tax=Nocardioides sp. TaxID=35761 RepID=UPI003518A805
MTSTDGDATVSAAQAAGILGVRVPTVYAYVSRGVLARVLHVDEAGHRSSRFDRAEVLRLAEVRRRPGAGMRVLIESDITQLDPSGRLGFRGLDLGEVLGLGSYEQTAAHLWQAEIPGPWEMAPDVVAALQLARPWLARVDDAGQRLRAAITAAAGASEAATGEGEVIAAAQQAVLAGIAGIASDVETSAVTDVDVVTRLLRALGAEISEPTHRLLTTTLSVLVDHELSASTVAARVAASLHADPWSCLLTGLHAMSGERQAGSVRRAADLLEQWCAGGGLATQAPESFGHIVYERSDPRFEAVLDVLAEVDAELHAAVVDLTVAVAREHSAFANIDLGLAAVARHLGVPSSTASALFLLARIPGLAAHVIEERPHDLRFRPRSL